ncbi:hypothetical protein F5Y00DRAFT_250205 [Daldinia vernicosa]|nr:hypothetical protein F5Y00DRAFT_250205 [Daldinia vernicosa]
MTTGRINQVTIVRRGWPTAPCGAEELVTVYTTEGGRLSALGRAYRAEARLPLFPSTFPRALVRYTRRTR